jgi:hypothetical protein
MHRLEILQYSVNLESDYSKAPEEVIKSLFLIDIKNCHLDEIDFISKTITDFPTYFKKIEPDNKFKGMATDDILNHLEATS